MPVEDRNTPIAPPVVRKITMADGFPVGILHLDEILKEVTELDLADSGAIRKELLMRVKKSNYVPQRAEPEYEAALFHEYQSKLGLVKNEPRTEKPGGK